MNFYLKLGDCVELEEYATKSISEKCSFKALNSRGEIIGVSMNGIVKKAVSERVILHIHLNISVSVADWTN